MAAQQTRDIKCVVVGDGAVGKTCLLLSYVKNEMPTEYNPTIFENLTTQVIVDDEMIALNLWDTAGQQDYDRLRPLSYPETDVFIVCYSLTSQLSLENVTEKWIPEVTYHCAEAPVILVGTKSDLRSDPNADKSETPVADGAAQKVVSKFTGIIVNQLECSAKTREGVAEVFNVAVRAAINAKKGVDSPGGGCCALM